MLSLRKNFPCISIPFLNLPLGNMRNIINSVGSRGCVAYMMPGGVPFSPSDCNNDPGTVYIQTTYTSGPANQQVPMPYTDYLAAGSASIASSSSAAQASSTSNSDSSSSDTAVSNWVSHHKALVIGATVAVIALLLICCCCLAFFRRKKYTRARPAPAPPVAPSPHYQCSPQQGMRRQEHYPMIQYQYGPNK
jgi:hypothetical protein